MENCRITSVSLHNQDSQRRLTNRTEKNSIVDHLEYIVDDQSCFQTVGFTVFHKLFSEFQHKKQIGYNQNVNRPSRA